MQVFFYRFAMWAATGLLASSACSYKSAALPEPYLTGSIQVEPAQVLADGKTEAIIEVQLYESSFASLAGFEIVLGAEYEAGGREGLEIVQPLAPTDDSGKATGRVRSTKAGQVRVWATAQPFDFEIAARSVMFVDKLAQTLGFAPPRDYPTGGAPHGLATADLNGDGLFDLVTANHAGRSLSVLLADDAGGLAEPFTVPCGGAPAKVAIADINGDEALDLLATLPAAASLVFFPGDDAGRFSAAVSFAVSSYPRGLAVGKLDGDDRLDVAVTRANGNQVSLFVGTEDSVLSSLSPALGTGGLVPQALDVGDLDGDGHLDLVVVNSVSHDLSLLEGPLGQMPTQPLHLATGRLPMEVLVRDLDGDGDQDIAVAYTGVEPVLGGVAVHWQSNEGFDDATIYETGPQAVALAAGDLNGDQKLDLAVAHAGNDSVAVLIGDPARAYTARLELEVGSQPRAIALADINGDGRLDIVTANRGASTVSVLSAAGGDRSSEESGN